MVGLIELLESSISLRMFIVQFDVCIGNPVY